MCAIGRRRNKSAPAAGPATKIADAIPVGGDSMSTSKKIGDNLNQMSKNLGSNKQKLTASDNYQG